MITLQQVKLPISHTKEELEKKILKTLRIKKEELLGYETENSLWMQERNQNCSLSIPLMQV